MPAWVRDARARHVTMGVTPIQVGRSARCSRHFTALGGSCPGLPPLDRDPSGPDRHLSGPDRHLSGPDPPSLDLTPHPPTPSPPGRGGSRGGDLPGSPGPDGLSQLSHRPDLSQPAQNRGRRSVPTGRVIKYPKKCAFFRPGAARRGRPRDPPPGGPGRGSWPGGPFWGGPGPGGPPPPDPPILAFISSSAGPRRASQGHFGGLEGVLAGRAHFGGSGGGVPGRACPGADFGGSRTGGVPGPARPAPRRPRRPGAGPGPGTGGRGGAGGGDGGVPGQSGPRRTRGAPRGVEGRDPPEGMPSLGADRSPETVTRVAEGRQPGPACRPGGDPIGRRASICSSRGTKVLARLTGGQRCRRERHRAKHRRAPTPRTTRESERVVRGSEGAPQRAGARRMASGARHTSEMAGVTSEVLTPLGGY